MTYEQRIRQELKRVSGTEEWIGVHCSPEDPEAFEVLLIAGVGSETISAHAFDTLGRTNGSRSITIESIVGVTVGGRYLDNLRMLRDAMLAEVHVPTGGDGHEGMLRAARDSGLVVSLRLEEETIQGFVREVGDGWAAITEVEVENGEDKGQRIVSLETAERVFIGGQDEMILATLFQARQMRDSIG